MAKIIIILATMLFSSVVHGQKGSPPKELTSNNVKTHFPQGEDFKMSALSRLKMSPGYKIEVVATGIGKPRMMAEGPDGSLYITRRDQGDVIMLKNKEGDAKFDELQTVMAEFKGVHGIAVHNGFLYMCSNKVLKKAKINTDGTLGEPEVMIDDLPDGGQHGNRTIAFGPDNMLYITVGSTCNDCNETNKENATILKADAEGKNRKIFARGLRNTIGIDWHPETKQLWGADNGTDWRGDDIPPEELNLIVENGDYGWPLVWGDKQIDETREDPPGSTKKEYAAKTESSVLNLPPHSAPINLCFLSKVNGFPADVKDDALITLHGSWNKSQPDGFKIIRVLFENGKPVKYEDFLSGFLKEDGATRFGRPAGLCPTKNGVYVSDDANGVIYMITANSR